METILRFAAKQPRASAPKVRSGCVTCKTRRVKCGEEKPRCARCVKGDRECEYKEATPITRNRLKIKTQTTAPSTRVTSLLPIHPRPPLVWQPSISIGDSKEQMFFQLFRDQIADNLGGTFENPFFNRLVLRECHSTPVVRHLVYAISALWRSFTSKDEEKTEHLQFAWVQESKALNSLRVALIEDSSQIRLAVIASGLLHSYESLRGNWETARQQLSSGVKLLETWRAKKNRGSDSATCSPEVDTELGYFFPRLELGLIIYAALNPYSDHIADQGDEPIRDIELSECFGISMEDKTSLTKLTSLSIRFVRKTNRLKRLKPLTEFPDFIIREQRVLTEALDFWQRALASPPPQDSTHQPLHFKLFSVGLPINRLVVTTALELDESIYEQHTHEFQEIVSNARDGASMPLFYIATRCRHPIIRREAIAILRELPARQSVWNTGEISLVAEWVVAIEEGGIDENGYVPEAWRIRMHTLKWVVKNDGIHVEGMQGAFDGEWTLRWGILQIE